MVKSSQPFIEINLENVDEIKVGDAFFLRLNKISKNKGKPKFSFIIEKVCGCGVIHQRN